MKTQAHNNGAGNGVNPINHNPAAQAPPPAFYVISIEGVEFVSDGKFQVPVQKERYSLKPYRNPSGKLVVQLSGYRPNASLASETPADADEENDESDGEDGSSNGKTRFRKNYKKLKVADAKRSELIREDANSSTRMHDVCTFLSEEEVCDAEAAMVRLGTMPAPDWTDSGWSLTKVVDYIMNHFKPCRNPKPLSDAIKAYLEMKDTECNRSAATLDSLQLIMKRLEEACPGKCVHQVTEDDLKPLIRRGTEVKSMRKYRSAYFNFFKWCAGKDRSWTPNNPAREVELPDRTDDTAIPQILPVDRVRELLKIALNFKGGRLFLFCVVAFACALRPSEMGRIQARRKILGKISFHFGERPEENYIDVIGKGRKWRLVEIPPEFVPFVRTYVQAGYPIISRNFFNDWTHLRALAGYLGSAGYLPDYLDAKQLIRWVDDFARHTGGSHHFNRYENEFKTSKWMGNSPKMLFGHYDGRPTKAETLEFYKIPSELPLPSPKELQAAGIPEGATDAELKKLKCRVDRHTTFGMKRADFELARTDYHARHPEAAVPERKGFTRGKGMWTKRRMLNLPKDQAAQIHLVWTNTVQDLARQHKVARSTMSAALQEMGLPAHLFPPKGYWQQRASGQSIPLPPEVQQVFPDGLPPAPKAVGRQIRLNRPGLAQFIGLVWEMKAEEIAVRLGWSKSTVEREIKRLHLPRPEPAYWLQEPEQRQLPETIKHLLDLNSERLSVELAKLSPVA